MSVYYSVFTSATHASNPLSPPPAGALTSQATTERVHVIEKSSGHLLTGPAAPTEATLADWLVKHPTYHVIRPGDEGGDKKSKLGSKYTHTLRLLSSHLSLDHPRFIFNQTGKYYTQTARLRLLQGWTLTF
jgi:hypothetical protein